MFRYFCFFLHFPVTLGAMKVRPHKSEVEEAQRSKRRTGSLYRVIICQSSIECCDWLYGGHFEGIDIEWWDAAMGPPIQAFGLHPSHPEAWASLNLREHLKKRYHTDADVLIADDSYECEKKSV